MRFVFFTHSISSDWNNGHVHFLRGVVRALQRLGHEVVVHEPLDGWSARHAMIEERGRPFRVFREDFPDITPESYDATTPHLERLLRGADVVVVQEWIEPALAEAIVAHRRAHGDYRLYFHDAHHRLLTEPAHHAALPLDGFDAVLAFGASLADAYRERTDARDVHVWHEAADTSVFQPLERAKEGDLVWIGNWGDEERTGEIERFILAPTERLGLQTTIHGVRYPKEALARLAEAKVRFAGWVANSRVPERFATHALTIHVPRGPYASGLTGIPTIRVFEALACGIPLVSAPWRDTEQLFEPGAFAMVEDADEATEAIERLLADRAAARRMAARGRNNVLRAHTCRHRAEELLHIDRSHRLRQVSGTDEVRLQDASTTVM